MTLDFHPGASLDAGPLLPARLLRLAPVEVERVTVDVCGRQTALGEVSRLKWNTAAPDSLVFTGETSSLQRVAFGMDSGILLVDGPVGRFAGALMQAGELAIHGDAAEFLGACLHSGLICVKGSAGHSAGARLPGWKVGMQGGVILVEGNAGDEAAAGMRRGLLVICGNAGASAGWDMGAGTILVFGSIGAHAGMDMRRGSLVAGSAASLLPSFFASCTCIPSWLRVYARYLNSLALTIPPAWLDGHFQRFTGDHISLGRGEILLHAKP